METPMQWQPPWTGSRRLAISSSGWVARPGRAIDAVVRVEEDGPTRRVELVLHAARGRRLVAHGEGRAFGPALTVALGRLGAQVARAKRTRTAATARRRVAKSGARRKLLTA